MKCTNISNILSHLYCRYNVYANFKFSSYVIVVSHSYSYVYISCMSKESLLKANVWKLFIAADVTNLGLWINVSF